MKLLRLKNALILDRHNLRKAIEETFSTGDIFGQRDVSVFIANGRLEVIYNVMDDIGVNSISIFSIGEEQAESAHKLLADPKVPFIRKFSLDDRNKIKQSINALRKRLPVNTIEISIDLETNSYDKIHNNDMGVAIDGAKEGQILEYAHVVKVPPEYKDLLSDIEDLELKSFLKVPSDPKSNTVGNGLFHNTTGFSEEYANAQMPCTYLTLDARLVTLLKEICNKLGGKLVNYHPRNHIKFRVVGKSVAFDMNFIKNHLPNFSQYLSHELIDVSVVKNIFKPFDKKFKIQNEKQVTHFAIDDAKCALADYEESLRLGANLLKLTGGKTLVDVNNELEKLIEYVESKR